MSILLRFAEFKFLGRDFFGIKNVFGFGFLHHSMFVRRPVDGY